MYKSDRKTYIGDFIKAAKQFENVSSGSYNPNQVTKIPGSYAVQERFTTSECIMAEANNVPASNRYSLPPQDQIK